MACEVNNKEIDSQCAELLVRTMLYPSPFSKHNLYKKSKDMQYFRQTPRKRIIVRAKISKCD